MTDVDSPFSWQTVALFESLVLIGLIIALIVVVPGTAESVLAIVALIFSIVSMLSQIIFAYLGWVAGQGLIDRASDIEARLNLTAGKVEGGIATPDIALALGKISALVQSDMSRRTDTSERELDEVRAEFAAYAEQMARSELSDPLSLSEGVELLVEGAQVTHSLWGRGVIAAKGVETGVEWIDVDFENSKYGRRRLDAKTAPLVLSTDNHS